MHWRWVVLVLCLAVAPAACSGTSSESRVGESGVGESGGSVDAGQWEQRLALLPLIDPAEESVEVTMGDLAAAAELAGVEWPASGGDPTDSLVALAGVGAGPVAVPLPRFVQTLGAALLDELPAVAGWNLDELDWVVHAAAPPTETTVGAGRIDVDAMAGVLGEDGPPWRLGEGEDLEPSLEDPHPLDQLGRPVTLTVVDGVLGLSTVSAGIDALSGTGPSMADVEPVSRLVALADERGCYGVTVYADDVGTTMVCSLPEVGEGPQVVAAAVGIEDPRAEVARISELDSSAVADSVTVVADGDLVVVEIDGRDDLGGRIAVELLARRDPLVPGFGG